LVSKDVISASYSAVYLDSLLIGLRESIKQFNSSKKIIPRLHLLLGIEFLPVKKFQKILKGIEIRGFQAQLFGEEERN
jgi:hypothetical protein